MTMSRQQRRAQERAMKKLNEKGNAFRKVSPMAEEVHRQGYEEGWQAGLTFAIKTCYAASVLALHDLEGYGRIRNTRFLRKMDGHVTNTLTTEDIIDEALLKAGVSLNFKATFDDERVREV